MKEMIYQKDHKVEVLHSGEYRGYKFAILNLGLHPTAYVENKAGFKEFGEADEFASPHGGFTYCGKASWDKEDLTPYIGWDYGHCSDYAGYYDENSDIYLQGLKKWTTQEIFDEVKEVIDTLIKNTNQGHEMTDVEKIARIIYLEYGISFADKDDKEAQYEHSRANDTATKIVNTGYGDTKQAVSEFAEKLKEYCQEQFDKLDKIADMTDDAGLSLEFIRRRDEYHNVQVKIDKLVKEVCEE